MSGVVAVGEMARLARCEGLDVSEHQLRQWALDKPKQPAIIPATRGGRGGKQWRFQPERVIAVLKHHLGNSVVKAEAQAALAGGRRG